MQLLDLKNQVAVVTGGASGIGAATVGLFEQCGAKVTVLDIADGVDVTDERAVSQAFSAIGAFDILVNSAGRAVRKPATELSGEEWDQVLDLKELMEEYEIQLPNLEAKSEIERLKEDLIRERDDLLKEQEKLLETAEDKPREEESP